MFRSVHEFVHDLRNPDLPPSFLCHGQEPEGHRQSSGSRSCSLRYTRAQSYRRERRLDDVGASDRLPVRGRKVVEREQLLLVLGESGDGLRIPISVLLRERLDLFLRDRLRLGLEDICAGASWRAAAAASAARRVRSLFGTPSSVAPPPSATPRATPSRSRAPRRRWQEAELRTRAALSRDAH